MTDLISYIIGHENRAIAALLDRNNYITKGIEIATIASSSRIGFRDNITAPVIVLVEYCASG